MEKEEILLRNRLIELSKIAYQKNIAMFSDFLNINEQNIFHQIPSKELYATARVFGGYQFAERQMVVFVPEALFFDDKDLSDNTISIFPISSLKITPVTPKYAQTLTHRDYLGAILNLGIERSKVGDIVISDNLAYVYVSSKLKDYICSDFTSVKRTAITVAEISLAEMDYQPKYEEITSSVSSTRLDSMISSAFHLSRTKAIPYIELGKVYVNSKLVTSNGHKLKDNDVVSVRGVGKFLYCGIKNTSKKGRYMIEIHKYV